MTYLLQRAAAQGAPLPEAILSPVEAESAYSDAVAGTLRRGPSLLRVSLLSVLVLLLGWGCAMMPPNTPPQDPFLSVEPGLQAQPPPQSRYRPATPPKYRRPQTPTPIPIPRQEVSPRPQQRPTPKTFVEPPGDSRILPPAENVPANSEQQREQEVDKPAPPPILIPPGGVSPTSSAAIPEVSNSRRMELIVNAPARRPVGSGAPFQLTIRNLSDLTVRNVSVVCEFDEALTFPGSEKRSVTHKVPKIDAGDAKESLLTLVSDTPGVHQCRFTLNVGSKTEAEQQASVEFLSRQLDWRVHGPEERTVGSRAEFNIPLVNLSRDDLRDLRVQVDLDAALTVREMTQGGKLGDRRVTWEIDRLGAKEGLLLQLEVECREPTSQACLRVTVRGAELPEDDAEACLTVKPITGPLDVRMQDVTDPVALGDTAELTVSVMNRGLQPLQDVVLNCAWPEGFEFVGAEAHAGKRRLTVTADVHDRAATLTPVSSLQPDETLEYRLSLTAQKVGAHRISVSVSEGGNDPAAEVAEPILVHR